MNKLEKDRYVSHVGHTHNNAQIWGQYERMVDFVFSEFSKTNRRFDEIAQPLLFTISHAIELALKENIKFFYNYNSKKQITEFENLAALVKSHDLRSLANEFKIVFNRFHKQVDARKEFKDELSRYYKTLEELNEVLERNAETFRYSEKLNKAGEIIKPSIKPSKKIDLLEIKKMFDSLKNLFIGAANEMAVYTDYIDYATGNPEYKKGRGKLYCQRLPYTEHYLESAKEQLDRDLKKIKENLWMSTKDYSNYEIQVWDNNIYIIEV